jgi:NADPH-dependent 2,4-dienoyl-CoA reductase/sulfur reductase-like enzyme
MKCPTANGAIRMSPQERVVILGGGFGGVHAALHLEELLARAHFYRRAQGPAPAGINGHYQRTAEIEVTPEGSTHS